MIIQLASIVLRICGILALTLGLLFWSGNALNFIGLHMLLGVAMVCALWVVGIGQAFSHGGNWLLAASAVLVGALAIALGMMQSRLMVGSSHWVIQVLHLLIGILAIGIGQIATLRRRKTMVGSTVQ